MAGIRDSLDRDGYERLSRALSEVATGLCTGELRVSGRPGGTFHFRNGLVVAVESPGAPGPDVLLLRSGRVSGAQWAELMREPGAGRWPENGLVSHGYAGSVQLRVVSMMAMQDAVFAVLAGRVEGCEALGEGHPLAPVPYGEAPARLLQEATRKLAALAALPRAVLPDGARLVPAPATDDELRWLPPSQRELLSHADGRRTGRDIAFRTGRSVFTVTVELSRMLQEGHLAFPSGHTPVTTGVPLAGLLPRVPDTSTRPAACRTPHIPPQVLSALASAVAKSPEATSRNLDTPTSVPDTTPIPAVVPDPAASRNLPRRRPGASGITETLGPSRNGTSWKGFFRLRSRIRPSETGV
ncbi:MarR family transcriptional regulator [Streptomyces sp. uw30]|uniref:MarR family transcriptional regulator n=1 Tax=Streptomyces sp. uw30 TaxID=1828179 RepID=UPI0021C639EE|nr:MarR family transcriptional regulator [Streptomyces sp. uw30]